MDAEEPDFRDYLESTGAVKALWNILIELDRLKNKPDDAVEYIRENLDRELTKQFISLKLDINAAEEEFSQLANEYPIVYNKFLKWKRRRGKKLAKGVPKTTEKTGSTEKKGSTGIKKIIVGANLTKNKAEEVVERKPSISSKKERPSRPSLISRTSRTSKTSKNTKPTKTSSQRKLFTHPEEENLPTNQDEKSIIELIFEEALPKQTTSEAQDVHGDACIPEEIPERFLPEESTIQVELLNGDPPEHIASNIQEINEIFHSQNPVSEEMSSKQLVHDKKVKESLPFLTEDEQSYGIEKVNEFVQENGDLEEETINSETNEKQNNWWKCCWYLKLESIFVSEYSLPINILTKSRGEYVIFILFWDKDCV